MSIEVLLINPPIPEKHPGLLVPPLGIAYLGSALREQGIETRIIDAPALNLDVCAVAEQVKQLKPQIVGITTTTPLANSAFALAKEIRPLTRWLILGGAHASAVGQKIFEQCPVIDFGFQGEAEEQFPALVKMLISGESNPACPGLILRDFSQEPVLISELNKIPFPAWELLPMSQYRHPLSPGRKVATIMSSRGCPYQCIFCDQSVCGTRFRARSPENVVEEIEQLYRNWDVRTIIFYDDLFTLKPERVIEICKLIVSRGLKIKWKCEGRVNLVNSEMLFWMKRAGCEMIAYGIESAHQKSLDWLNKGVTLDQVQDAVKLTRKAGIKVLGYFIFGIPIETYEEELDTIDFAIRLKLDYVQFASLSPFPGSRLYEIAIKQGWYREGKALGPEEYGESRPLLITDYWTEEKLSQILKQAHRRFYLRPGYIIRSGLRIRGLINLVKSGLRLIRWLLKSG